MKKVCLPFNGRKVDVDAAADVVVVTFTVSFHHLFTFFLSQTESSKDCSNNN